MANTGDSPAETGNTSSEVFYAVDVLILANPQVSSSAGLRISRSHSVNAVDSERRKPRWMRRSLPPAKRERRRENTKPSETDATPKEKPTIEPPRQRSKSMKTTAARPTKICARSLSFASSSYVVKVRQAHDETDGEHRVHGFRQLLRKTSIQSTLPVVQQIQETKSRKWTVAIFSLVAAMLASLRGFTITFSSNTTLDLMGATRELPSHYLFTTTLSSIFAVRFDSHGL